MVYSYVLNNVHLVTGQRVDIVIEEDQIIDIAQPGRGSATESFDYSDCYVSSGWIDLHVHAWKDLTPYGDDMDKIGIDQGVTTIVDAGSCGAENIKELYQASKQAKTSLYSFLNISRIGLKRIDELSQLHWLKEKDLMEAVNEYSSFIIGLKARISKSVVQDQGIQPLKIAREFSTTSNLPLMIHIGSGPPDIKEIVPLLQKGDIITHFLNGKPNNLFDKEGKPIKELIDAVNRGVLLDVGHGSASFSFRVAEQARKGGLYPFSISTDIYKKNRLSGPVYSLADVASKFLYLGYSLKQIIDAITVEPAKAIGKPHLANLEVGSKADLTLFKITNKRNVLTDSEGEERTTNQMIDVKGVVKNGEFIFK